MTGYMDGFQRGLAGHGQDHLESLDWQRGWSEGREHHVARSLMLLGMSVIWGAMLLAAVVAYMSA